MKPHVSIAISRSHSLRGFSMKSRSTVQPAQFTSTSTAPNEPRANSTADETESQSVTSTCRATIAPAGASASTLLACSRSTSATKTRAPSPAKPRLIARPRLDAPPVTMTTGLFNPSPIRAQIMAPRLFGRGAGRAERLSGGTLGFVCGLRADPRQPKSRHHADLRPLLPVAQGCDQVRPSFEDFCVLHVRVAQPVGHAQLFEDLDGDAEMVLREARVALSLLEVAEEQTGVGEYAPFANSLSNFQCLLQGVPCRGEVVPPQISLAQSGRDVTATPSIHFQFV